MISGSLPVVRLSARAQAGPARGSTAREDAAMITLDQTLYSLERARELMRSAGQLEPNLRHAIANLKDFQKMLDLAREKGSQDPKELERYVAQVLAPQLATIVNALQAGSQTQLEHLQSANEMINGLISSLELVTRGGPDNLLS
jgi:hypothetical protein